MTKLRRLERSLPFLHVLWLSLLFGSLTLGAKRCERVSLGAQCEHEGNVLNAGEATTAADGCNACTCMPSGEVTCTRRVCPPGNGNGNGNGNSGEACGGLRGLSCPSGEYCNYAPDAFCGAADQTGTCTPRPEACTLQYDPVCGCDDRTYGNACEAASAGVSVVSEGECGSEPGEPGEPGTCVHDGRSYAVGDFVPVDSCNDCRCLEDGNIACTDRACEEPMGAVCGTRGVPPCEGDQFCAFPQSASCGDTDAPGVCQLRPDACDLAYDPVCGCDGQTYGNECAANAAGVSARFAGECEAGEPEPGTCRYAGQTFNAGDSFPAEDGCNRCTCERDGSVSCTERACEPAQACGGLRGLACPDGQYCNYAPDALCGAADATGTCADIPQACTREYAPVCGCDDRTYSNACTAASAGVSVVHRGECETNGGGTGFCEYNGQRYAVGDGFPSDDGCNTCTCTEGGQVACTLRACVDFCGGIAGFGCPDGQFCNYPPDAMCGAADQTGTCEPQPQACTLQYDPVCGCDGETYGNACAAASEGMSIVHEGEC